MRDIRSSAPEPAQRRDDQIRLQIAQPPPGGATALRRPWREAQAQALQWRAQLRGSWQLLLRVGCVQVPHALRAVPLGAAVACNIA